MYAVDTLWGGGGLNISQDPYLVLPVPVSLHSFLVQHFTQFPNAFPRFPSDPFQSDLGGRVGERGNSHVKASFHS